LNGVVSSDRAPHGESVEVELGRKPIASVTLVYNWWAGNGEKKKKKLGPELAVAQRGRSGTATKKGI